MALKSSFSNMLIVLTVVTLVASVSLGFVFQWTKEPIEKARLEKQVKAIDAVLGDYTNNPVEEQFRVLPVGSKDSLVCFPARKNTALTGMAIKTYSTKGYSGYVWLMVGFKEDGSINNIMVLEHKETPGLGSKMNDAKFLNQFINKHPESFTMKVKKDGGAVDAISGATISSRAFCEAVLRAYDTFKQQDNGKTN